jgi:tetratricopeptide (TPR) repeat protein
MLGISIQTINIPFKLYKKLGFILGILLIFFLSVRTVIRNANWSDALTLYMHDSKLSDNYDLENNVGGEFFANGNYREALTHTQKSVLMFPYEANLADLGNVYLQLGDISETKKYYYRALNSLSYVQVTHKHAEDTYILLGNLLIFYDSPSNSKKIIQTGLLDYPNSVELLDELAISDYLLRQQTAALTAAKKAVILEPDTDTRTLYSIIFNKRPIHLNR